MCVLYIFIIANSRETLYTFEFECTIHTRLYIYIWKSYEFLQNDLLHASSPKRLRNKLSDSRAQRKIYDPSLRIYIYTYI